MAPFLTGVQPRPVSTSIRSWGGVAVNPSNVVRRAPQHPERRSTFVDGLVHEGAAAGQRLRSLPTSLFVVGPGCATICSRFHPSVSRHELTRGDGG